MLRTSKTFALSLAAIALIACGDEGPSLQEPSSGSPTGAPSSTPPAASAGTDAGAFGSSSADAPASSTPAPCTGDDLCVDFESTAAAPTPVAPNCSGTGALALDSTVAHTGTGSLRIDGKGGYCNHVFWSAGADALARFGDVVHVRFFVRFASALGEEHVTFLASKDDATTKDLRMGGQKKVLMLNRELDDATLPDLSPDGTAASREPVVDAWTCIELTLDRKTGAIQTQVDGTKLDALSTGDGKFEQQWSTKSGPLGVTDLRLGWEAYGGGDMKLWLDDVAISRNPIGCF